MELYPLKFQPIYKEKVWGGNNLSRVLDRELAEYSAVGESWELCAHVEGTSIISNGIFFGEKLDNLIRLYDKEILGEQFKKYNDAFPLLFKFIDANDKLSVQVHPEDHYAKINEGELGKTEMWYIIDAIPGAKLVYGLKQGVSSEDFKRSIEEGSVEAVLNEVEVEAGDMFFIPAGTVHAIGEGIVLAEIQQNSDTTYRVFDWNRLGLDGKPRQLHIEKALDVIDFTGDTIRVKSKGICIQEDGYRSTYFACCPYFTVELLDIDRSYTEIQNRKRFEVLICIDGDFQIIYDNKQEKFKLGETVLIPANMKEYKIEGQGKIIKTYIAHQKEIQNMLTEKGFEVSSIIYT